MMVRKSLKETLKRCAEYRKNKSKYLELAKNLVELAEIYQQKQTADDRMSAISAASEAVEVLRHEEGSIRNNKLISFAYRILAESYAEEDNRQMALKCSEKFRQTAQASGNHSQIQLSLHVSAWVLEKLWILSETDIKTDLEQAYKFAQKSLDYLEKYSAEIKKDREAVENCETPEFRKSNLERFLAGLAGNLGRRTEAERYFRSAMDFAMRKNLSELKYELHVTQLDFPWVNKKKLAQILVNEAPAKKKGTAKLELSQIFIIEGDMEKAFRVLLDIKAHTDLHEDDVYLLNSRLVFVYKYLESFRLLKNDSLPAKERRRIYEKLGDWIIQYSSTNKETLLQGIKYYNNMLLNSRTDKEKIPALISLGTTYFDLKQYADALRNFKDCLECEKRIGKPFSKTFTTQVLIFNANCKGRLVSKEDLEDELNTLLSVIPQSKRLTKRNLCKNMAEYLSVTNDPRKTYYQQEAKKYQGTHSDRSEDEVSSEEEENTSPSSSQERSDADILKECERKARSINDNEAIEKRKTWKNSHGETELHLEAKGDNTERLKKLLNFKYPINAQDNSGWTALHEAINHKKVDNVKVLLNYGARLDIASYEGEEGGLDEGRIGGKITPLMDACANFTEGIEMITIAEILFRKCPQTVTAQNEDEWTAADFTIDSIKKLEEEGQFQSIPRANALLKAMEKEFKNQKVPFRWTPPPVKSRAKPGQNRKKKSFGPLITGVSEYQNAMNQVGSRAHQPEDVDIELPDSPPPVQKVQFADIDDFDVIPDENIRPASQQNFSNPYNSQIAPTRRSNTQIRNNEEDDFIINDIIEPARKKKKRESATQNIRRIAQEENNYLNSVDDDFLEDMDITDVPVIKARKLQRFDSPERVERTPSSNLTPSPSITPTVINEKLSVSISFADSTGKQIRNNLITAVESIASVRTIYEKCTKIIVGNQTNLTICLEDGAEVDSDMPLSLLKDSESGFVKLKCITERAAAQTFFQSYNQEFKDETEIIEKLRNFSLPDTSSEIDFSKMEVDYCIDAILRSLNESAKPIYKINLTHCDLGNVDGETLRKILDKCQEFKACSSSFSNAICQQITQPGINFPSLTYLDLSFNRIDGNALSFFISTCPSLSNLIAKGLDLRNGSNQLAESISNLSSLTHLSLQNSLISTAALEQIISTCNSLLYLDLGSAEISFAFSPCWLPTLRELRMAACSVHSWESFLDWISLGAVEKLDLSCTSFTADHILSLCERKVDTSTNITLRLMKCPRVEFGIDNLKEEILKLLENRTCPIRMQLPAEITQHLRLQTALTEQFLID